MSGQRVATGKDYTSLIEESNAFNPQTAADMLGLTGEVFIQKSQYGGGSPMIRGFATNRLLYSIDGVRMNSAIFRAGNLQNVISLDPFTIGNTELFFGPGAVSYGSDAIGGAMVFSTIQSCLSKNGKPVAFGSATVRTATASNELTAHVHAGVGWKRWALLTKQKQLRFIKCRSARIRKNPARKNSLQKRRKPVLAMLLAALKCRPFSSRVVFAVVIVTPPSWVSSI